MYVHYQNINFPPLAGLQASRVGILVSDSSRLYIVMGARSRSMSMSGSEGSPLIVTMHCMSGRTVASHAERGFDDVDEEEDES